MLWSLWAKASFLGADLGVQSCRGKKKTRALSVIVTACDDKVRLTVQGGSVRVIDIASGNKSIKSSLLHNLINAKWASEC